MKPTRHNLQVNGVCHTAGFTYIELLAVVSIIGLIVTLVVTRIDTDQDRIAFLEARRFAQLVEMARDESIINGVPMGVFIDVAGKSYGFAYFTDGWYPATTRGTEFRTRNIPDTVVMEILLSSTVDSGQDPEIVDPGSDSSKPPQPQVVMEPSGLVSEFVMKFAGSAVSYLVNPDLDQDIVVSRKSNSD